MLAEKVHLVVLHVPEGLPDGHHPVGHDLQQK